MPSHPKYKPQVDAERPNIGARLAGNPENDQMAIWVVLKELAFVDGSNPELAFDGGDERGALEDGSGERLEGSADLGMVRDGGVEAGDANVLLSGSLLGFDEAGGAIDADDEVPGDFGVEGAAVAGLFNAEEALDPGDDLVGGGVGGLVEVEDAVSEVFGDGAFEGGVAGGQRRVVAGADVEAVVVLEEDRPLGGVERRGEGLGFDQVVFL